MIVLIIQLVGNVSVTTRVCKVLLNVQLMFIEITYKNLIRFLLRLRKYLYYKNSRYT